jgi:hypothetical protein
MLGSDEAEQLGEIKVARRENCAEECDYPSECRWSKIQRAREQNTRARQDSLTPTTSDPTVTDVTVDVARIALVDEEEIVGRDFWSSLLLTARKRNEKGME